jgi:DNA mismatch repair protein MutL
MGSIKLLDKYLIDRIAAGEVVQRPFNVVKELMENSIDAKCTAMSVEIKDGGVSFIRITDNGSGMMSEDALMSFKRHATSKISKFDDLDAIGTLGFRGEALSAISAVSHMDIITKSADEESGISISLSGGALNNKKYLGMADGTSIIVKNLFYNTPARLKFLKSHGAEASAISDIIARFILAYTNVAIKFISNDKTIMQSFGEGNLLLSAKSVYGADIKEKTLTVNYNYENIKINGLIGVPQFAFKNRKKQSAFINGRYVLNNNIVNIIAKAYSKWLVPGLFPFYILNIELPLSDVDVNIHPNKLEIKFRDEKMLETALTEAIEFTLSSTNSLPKIKFSKSENIEDTEQQVFSVFHKDLVKPENIELNTIVEGKISVKNADYGLEDALNEINVEGVNDGFALDLNFDDEKEIISNLNEQENTEIKPDPKYIGSFLNSYLLVEYGTTLLLIDQHAAHERLIFDKLLESFNLKAPKSQMMLIPETLTLSLEEKTMLEENKDILLGLGFSFEINDNLSASFSALPSLLTDLSIEELIDDFTDSASEENNSLKSNVEKLIMTSCKKAVKAGNNLDYAEAKHLVDLFINTGHMPTCPHGRPVITTLSEKELKKYFRRTV